MREISIRKKTSRFGDRSSDPEALIDAASRCSRPEAEVLQNLLWSFLLVGGVLCLICLNF